MNRIERLSFVDFPPCMLTKHVHDRQTDICKVKKYTQFSKKIFFYTRKKIVSLQLQFPCRWQMGCNLFSLHIFFLELMLLSEPEWKTTETNLFFTNFIGQKPELKCSLMDILINIWGYCTFLPIPPHCVKLPHMLKYT